MASPWEYFNMPSSFAVQMMTHLIINGSIMFQRHLNYLSAPPEANLLPSLA